MYCTGFTFFYFVLRVNRNTRDCSVSSLANLAERNRVAQAVGVHGATAVVAKGGVCDVGLQPCRLSFLITPSAVKAIPFIRAAPFVKGLTTISTAL